jgi:diaminopimelate epimerase
MGMLKFAKLSCGGNDFIVIDSRNSHPEGDLTVLVRRLCDRRNGVGADGLIFLVADEKLPFGMLLFNEDGSRAEVSYNGSRCVGLYAFVEGIAPAEFAFASAAGEVGVTVHGDDVTLRVPPPSRIDSYKRIVEQGREIQGDWAIVGVPYFVVFTEDLRATWLEGALPAARTNPAFPEGTNVAAASPPENGACRARFFERGVAEETPSSGTGCVAVALTAALRYGIASPITVKTAGGDFPIKFHREGDLFLEISSSGKVNYIFRGEIIQPVF